MEVLEKKKKKKKKQRFHEPEKVRQKEVRRAYRMRKVVQEREDRKTRVMQLLQDPLKVTRELNNRSLHHFLEWAWPALSSQPFQDNWHLHYLCEKLEEIAYQVGERRRKEHDLLINISPGTTKTILVSIVFPVWCWTKWYWMRFITASYSGTLSLESAEYSRDLVKSDRFRMMYPELGIKKDKDTKSNFKVVKYVKNPYLNGPKYIIEHGGNRYSTSIGGTLTGFHADIIIWDDPINPQQALSEKELATANTWFNETLPTRKTNKEVSATIGIMQRVHENDPSGHLLAKKKSNLKHVSLPGEIRNYKKQLKPRMLRKYYVDDLFDAKRMPWHVISELEEDLGQYGFAGQIGQDPTPPGGGMFKVDNFQMTSEIFDEKDIKKKVRYWDKAATTDDGAWTVGTKMYLLHNGMYVIEDVKRGQWSSEVREKIIRQTAKADGKDVDVVIEQEPGSGGKESAEGTVRGLAGFIVHKDRPTGDKADRADPFSVQVNNGSVYVRVAVWNAIFMNEFRLFPNSKYKDQVDTASGAFNFLIKKKRVKRVT